MANKYHNKKVEIDGHLFDSLKEGNRYLELKMMKNARGNDKVIEIELQPKFPHMVNGIKCFTYIADFRVVYPDRIEFEDVKGMFLPISKLKIKCIEAQYGIKIKII